MLFNTLNTTTEQVLSSYSCWQFVGDISFGFSLVRHLSRERCSNRKTGAVSCAGHVGQRQAAEGTQCVRINTDAVKLELDLRGQS